MVVYGLCVNGDGEWVKNPNEILHSWTWEQVQDAYEIRGVLRRLHDDERARLKAGR